MHKCILARTQELDSLMSPAQKHWKVSDQDVSFRQRNYADRQKLGGPPKGEVFLSSMGGSLVWGGGNKMEEILKEKFWLLLSHKYDVMGYSLTVVRTDSSYGGLHLSY